MHELVMARDLFKDMLSLAAGKNLGRISLVKIRAGEAAGVEAEFLLHSLRDHLFPGTPAEGCEVEITVEKASVVCSGCGGNPGREQVLKCGSCGGCDFDIAGGNEVVVEDVYGSR